MWVDFPEVDFLTTTPKYRKKKRNSPSCVHVLLKTSRSIREFYVFTSSYYYGRWCILRVAARLAGFLFDDVLVAVTHGLLSSPIRCETKITKNWPRFESDQTKTARSLRMKKRSGLHTVLPEDSSYVWEKKINYFQLLLWVKCINAYISWRWRTMDAMFSCNLWDNKIHKDWELFVNKKIHFFLSNIVER